MNRSGELYVKLRLVEVLMADSEHFQVISESGSVRVVELRIPPLIDGEDFDVLNNDLLTTIDESDGGQWVIDLSKVSYLGSAMLGLMVNVRQRIKRSEGVLVLCGMNERLLDIFETSSLVRLFRIARTRAEAVRIVQRS